MTLLGIPGFLQWCSLTLGASNSRSSTSPQCRETGCHPDKHAVFQVLISIHCPWRVTIIPFIFLGKLCICNSNSHPTQIHFRGNYILLLLLFFWTNKLQTTPLLPGGKKSDSSRWQPIKTEYACWIVLFHGDVPCGTDETDHHWLAASTEEEGSTGYRPHAHPLNLDGESQDFLKDHQLILSPWTHQWTISCLTKCFVHNVVFDSHAVHVPRWHGKMKNLTSLDYSSDLHDDTNYIV